MTLLRKERIRKIADCPQCGAKAGVKCFQKDGKTFRSSNHQARVEVAQRHLGLGKVKKEKPKIKGKKGKGRTTSFYASWEWKKVRFEALKANGHRCQCCGWRPGDTEHGHLVVDHIKPRRKHPELQLELSNLQVLCNDCNMGKSDIYEDDFRDVEDWFRNIMRET